MERSNARIKGLVLAAGFSRRMGTFKPLMRLEKKTVIETTIESMLAADVLQVVLVLGYRGREIEEAIGDRYKGRLRITYNEAYATSDMLASVKQGVRSLGPCDAFFLLPGDMPDIARSTYHAVRECWLSTDRPLAFPTRNGYRKHPPLIDAKCIPTILSHTGQGGLRTLWNAYENDIATVAVDDIGCETDLDTGEDYRRFTKLLERRNERKQSHREERTYGYQ